MRGLDPIGQRRIDGDAAVGGEIDEALRKIAVVGGKRRADFALGDVLIEASTKRLVGDGDWIVRDWPSSYASTPPRMAKIAATAKTATPARANSGCCAPRMILTCRPRISVAPFRRTVSGDEA